MTGPELSEFDAAVDALLRAGYLEIPVLAQPPRAPRTPRELSSEDVAVLQFVKALPGGELDVVIVYDTEDCWAYRLAASTAPVRHRDRMSLHWGDTGPAAAVITALLGLPAAPDFPAPRCPADAPGRPCPRPATQRPTTGSAPNTRRSRRRVRVAGRPTTTATSRARSFPSSTRGDRAHPLTAKGIPMTAISYETKLLDALTTHPHGVTVETLARLVGAERDAVYPSYHELHTSGQIVSQFERRENDECDRRYVYLPANLPARHRAAQPGACAPQFVAAGQ
ncbi:hypothetical protein [Amycolatopsis sp. NPDC059021]|uniref:hypothetical protein n=1 Tax=Amycolatopsis sp. NPDC059021 TaxID=3346704 RepID=UPI00366B52A3